MWGCMGAGGRFLCKQSFPMGWRCWQRARLIGCPLSWCFPVLEQTHGTAAVRCAISGAHGCKWGSGREKGVGYVCVCVQWDICTLVGPCKVGWADAGMLSDLLTLLVFPNRNDSAVPCSSWLQSRPCTAASPGVAFVGICRVISGKISRLQ